MKDNIIWQGEHIRMVRDSSGSYWSAGRRIYHPVCYHIVLHESTYDVSLWYFMNERGILTNREGRLTKEIKSIWIEQVEGIDREWPVWFKKVKQVELGVVQQKEKEETARLKVEMAALDLLHASQMALEYIIDGEVDKAVVIKKLKQAIRKSGRKV